MLTVVFLIKEDKGKSYIVFSSMDGDVCQRTINRTTSSCATQERYGTD